MKKAIFSKTIIIAILQIVAAIVLAMKGHLLAGGTLTLKSVFDILLRYLTTEAIGNSN